MLDSLYVNEELPEVKLEKNTTDKGSDFGTFLGLLHNTIDFVDKTKRSQQTKFKNIRRINDESKKKNLYVNNHIKLYLRVVHYCKKWRMKTEAKNAKTIQSLDEAFIDVDEQLNTSD